MKILAIETSCDDTGISIIETPKNKMGDFRVLSNIVSSQIKVHKKYGGVFPAMAKREHQRNLLPVLKQALGESKLLKISNFQLPIFNKFSNSNFQTLNKILEKEGELYKNLKNFLEKYEKPFDYAQDKPDIDLIAVTEGPGLEPCLWVGVNFAKALSYYWDIPIVPVNHIEAHILVNYLDLPADEAGNSNINFPAISLVVSGGHTQLIFMKGIGKYQILGETRDDAAGECFDKAAKILGLGYPGGPEIARLAEKFQPSANFVKAKFSALAKLPRPMIGTKDYDFSFSGLKTAVLYHHKKQPKNIQKSKEYIGQMCVEVQQAIIDVLIKKTIKAAKDYKVKTIILGGGVSANEELRKQFSKKVSKELYPNFNGREKKGIKLIFPDIKLSTDNALMIAITGYFHRDKKINPSTSSGLFSRKIEAKANLRI